MKKFFNTILSYGVQSQITEHGKRMVRTTNLLNLIVVCFVFISFINLIPLGWGFSFLPVLSILFMALCSIFLNKVNKTRSAFLLFTIYVNLSIFFFCMFRPFETQNYLYYFPVIVSVVLLNNPSFNDKLSLVHMAVCVLFFTATFVVEIPNFRSELAPEKILFIRHFNIITAMVITAILSFLLTRVISKQNNEIMVQNHNLVRAKQVVNASLKEKEVLLAELHHRVKNNLAIISGLLNLQDDATNNEEAKEIIGDSKNRIMSMALVHRMLYENSELKNLDLSRYISELVFEMFNSYNLTRFVDITLDCDKVVLPVNKSVPLGLILNEIVTNSIKYVYKSNHKIKGKFFISVKEESNFVTMIVKDNGPGFPADFNAEADNLSLGIYLIKSLTEQIDGTVKFLNDSGARIEVKFLLV